VGKLLEGKTPKQATKLRLLDPACGSGSFLIGAYQHLLDWHRDWYVKDGPEKHAAGKQPALFQAAKEDWRLTTTERKRILLNNIFGVDIDPQAVEVTKLSLLLKVLEGENAQTISQQLKFFHERALPDLGSNIKCGNSLIGPDFYEQQMNLLDDEERLRINVFDWQAEFPEIMKAGGFDAVIGNPPYVLGRETFDDRMKEYLSARYISFGGKYDLYVYFTEKATNLLMDSGRLGYILPNTLLANENATNLRMMILDQTQIEVIKTFEARVFEKAQVESVVIILQRTENSTRNHILVEGNGKSVIPQAAFRQELKYRFNININPAVDKLIGKIQSISVPLGTLTDICIGIQLGGSSGDDKKESFLSKVVKDRTHKKVLDGRDINRYSTNWNGFYVRYGDWLHRKRDEKYFLNAKIMIRQIGKTPFATIDEGSFYTLNTIYNLINTSNLSLHYFLGIINSKLGFWFWVKKNFDFKTIFPKIKKAQIEAIPIRALQLANPTDKSCHDRMVELVERMLALHKQLAAAKIEHEKTALQRQIEATDRQIDALVYELYGLTEEEIKIVEGRE
jgi:methylase of polypeptide subunit release factors